MWKSLPGVYRQCAVCYTDFWSAYEKVIPSLRHKAVGKKSGKTNHIERFNNTLRQRISRLVRDTLSFSKKLENHIGALLVFHPPLQCLSPGVAGLYHYIFITTKTSCHYGPKQYLEGYEGYGELLLRVGETSHQSCLVLTSREKPKEIRLLEGETLPVRSLKLKGLQAVEGEKIFIDNGCFWESQTQAIELIEYYAGNPLALKSVSRTIQKVFDGSISEYLKHKIAGLGNISHVLAPQFERLSDGEKEIIKWMAINRHPASFSALRQRILPVVSPQKLLENLESLEERSLIEKRDGLFSLTWMVIEYVTDQLIEEQITQFQFPISISN